jgi:membrane protease YdiL (CAAX protease family)
MALGCYIFLAKYTGIQRVNFYRKNSFQKQQILLIIILSITWTIVQYGSLGINVYLASLFSYDYAAALWGFKEVTPIIAPNENLGNNLLSILLFILCQTILGPIIEEVYFRGLIFKHLSYRTGFVLSAVVSAILFAMLHDKSLYLSAFFSGILYAYIYQKTSCLLYCIALHFLVNVYGWLMTGLGFLSFLTNKNLEEISLIHTWSIEIILFLVFTLVSIFVLTALLRSSNNR